jgi:hypothetical protein
MTLNNEEERRMWWEAMITYRIPDMADQAIEAYRERLPDDDFPPPLSAVKSQKGFNGQLPPSTEPN